MADGSKATAHGGRGREAGAVELRGAADLHLVLRDRAPVLSLLALGGVVSALRASRTTRSLLSSLMTVHISFDFRSAALPDAAAAAEAARRRQQDTVRLPQGPADAPRVYLSFHLQDAPLKRKIINRHLARASRAVKWEDCDGVRLVCRGDLPMLDRPLMQLASATLRSDADAFLDDARLFRHVVRLSLTVTQLIALPSDLCLPQILRLKVTCGDAVFSDGVLAMVEQVFPQVERLHLAVLPSALLPLCGPGFTAPPDFRMTLLQAPPDQAGRSACEANFFVAAHLFSLPFHWRGQFFSGVLRLQMSELNEDHFGLAVEQMADVLQSLPQLRRLGTISAKAANLLNFVRDGCALEELVIVMEMDEVEGFFRIFLPLEKDRRRSRLQRLAVHMLASDGCSKPPLEREGAICAGWYQIACNLLRPTGCITFSVGGRQIFETAPCQLPWFEPAHFSLDGVGYSGGRLPRSTPLRAHLPYYWPELLERPSGTLVTGTLRPSMDVDALLTPQSPPRPSAGRKTTRGSQYDGIPSSARPRTRDPFVDTCARLPSWLSMQLADAIEVLVSTKGPS